MSLIFLVALVSMKVERVTMLTFPLWILLQNKEKIYNEKNVHNALFSIHSLQKKICFSKSILRGYIFLIILILMFFFSRLQTQDLIKAL